MPHLHEGVTCLKGAGSKGGGGKQTKSENASYTGSSYDCKWSDWECKVMQCTENIIACLCGHYICSHSVVLRTKYRSGNIPSLSKTMRALCPPQQVILDECCSIQILSILFIYNHKEWIAEWIISLRNTRIIQSCTQTCTLIYSLASAFYVSFDILINQYAHVANGPYLGMYWTGWGHTGSSTRLAYPQI
jgi:hypothetical protein